MGNTQTISHEALLQKFRDSKKTIDALITRQRMIEAERDAWKVKAANRARRVRNMLLINFGVFGLIVGWRIAQGMGWL